MKPLKEILPEKKKVIENMLLDDPLFQEKGMDGVKGYNQAIDDCHAKLGEVEKAIKEKQGKRFVTLMNQALEETELPEKVWKKIAKVNQLILDK